MPNRLVLMVALLMSGLVGTAHAQPDLPCDNWTLHTRTLPNICPEVILDNLTAEGIASIWGLAFDTANTLYFTRPATGQVMRMVYHDGRFDPPQVFAEGLDFPTGIVCNREACYVGTNTTIIRLQDGKQTAILSDLPGGEPRPVHIGPDGTVYTAYPDSSDEITHQGDLNVIHRRIGDFDWSSNRDLLWYSSAESALIDQIPTDDHKISLSPDSNPAGIAFYHGDAFPQFQNGLLVVTSGSWNARTIAGFELLFIPFDANGNPGVVTRLIPANTAQSSSDAALYLLTFYPDHPESVAVDANGWIYVAVREGRIIRLRPRGN